MPTQRSSQPGDETLRAGNFVYEPASDQLLLDGEPVKIRRKARELLHFLLRERHRTVSLEEILAEVWKGTAVSEQAVTRTISAIRAVLALDPAGSCSLDNEYGSGYQLRVRPCGATAHRDGTALADQSVVRVATQPGLDFLQASWNAVGSSSCPVALVLGDPGVGKSTLLRSFSEQLESETEGLAIFGRCLDQQGDPEPFFPLLQAMDSAERRYGAKRLSSILHQNGTTWLLHFPHLQARPATESLAQSLAGSHAGRPTREALAVFRRLAEQRPLILVLEDLHWADAATLDFIEAVSVSEMGPNFLLVATCRESQATFGDPRLAKLLRRAQQTETTDAPTVLRLEPWSRSTVAEYLGRRFECDLGETFVDVVFQRSGGIALLVSGLADMAVREGFLEHRNGAWKLATEKPIGNLSSSSSAQPLIQEQLNLLEPEDRSLLEAAAVLGHEFRAADIARAIDSPAAQVFDRLSALSNNRLFVAHLGAAVGARQFGFRHAYFRDGLMRAISPSRLRELCGRIAATMEGGATGRGLHQYLAEVFSKAGMSDRAADHWETAAGEACRHFAYDAAADCLRRAIEELSTLGGDAAPNERIAERWLDLGNVLIMRGPMQDPNVKRAFERCRERSLGCGAGLLAFRANAGMVVLALTADDATAARESSRAMLEYASSHQELQAMAHAFRGYYSWLAGSAEEVLGDSDAGLAVIDHAVPGLPALDDLELLLRQHRFMALSLTGNERQWHTATKDALRRMPVTNHQNMWVFLALGRSALFRDQGQLAEEWLTKAAELADEMARQETFDFAQALIAAARCLQGTATANALDDRIEACRTHGRMVDDEILHLALARASLACGEFDRARTALTAAFERESTIHDAERWRLLGELRALTTAGEGKGVKSGREKNEPDPLACFQRSLELAQQRKTSLYYERTLASMNAFGFGHQEAGSR